jgi:hypothetical protein
MRLAQRSERAFAGRNMRKSYLQQVLNTMNIE